jgi:quinoprotein glucose dehydrogenase
LLFLTSVLLVTGAFLTAEPEPQPYTPSIDKASDQGLKAMARFQLPKGFQIDLWAAEPLLANPVAFCFDEKGRCYVAETFRLHAGVTDIRGHMDWLDDDLASRNVEDRVAMMTRRDGKNIKNYAIHHDRVRMLEDTKGEGKADKSTVFADGFHNIPDGIGAGVVARRGKVWYTCIPDLWLLQDTKGEGKADVVKSLSHGYGVHVGFLGHDLHGLRFGPDGKLYFSLGDRGLHVKTPDGLLDWPDAGAVLRCNPDGSELELFHLGLRNPQELAFDDFGNLFTMDNNSDSGDRVRWVHLIEGGDSGWRIGYQFGTPFGDRGPWNTERMWEPRWEGQPAWIVPPLFNLGDGPSGLTHYPGTGFSDKYKGHFFLADFRGGPGNSGVRTFKNEPAGATFKLVDNSQFLWSILPTDVEFGYDGGLYVSDWVDGWGLPKKGRLYKITDPEGQKNPIVAEVKKLFAEGFEKRPADELGKLLGHADQRVRQEAQFALAERGQPSVDVLVKVARSGPSVLARVHAIWGLGQLHGSGVVGPANDLVSLAKDPEVEVRTAALRVVGDRKIALGLKALTTALKDESPRVRLYAALGLARLGQKESLSAVVDMLRANDDKDAYLRHAGVMALVGTKDAEALVTLGKDPQPCVRLAALLALRKLGNQHVADFLDDATPLIVAEAARAINDAPIAAALPNLAALIRRQGLPKEVMFRVLNACFRIGTPEMAKEVATFAARSDAPEALRVEAVKCLGDWTKPSGRDRIIGIWRPLPERAPEVAANAFKTAVGGIFSGPAKVREEAVKVAAKLGIKEVGPLLADIVKDGKVPARVRVESLLALESLKHAVLDATVQGALADGEPRVRSAARSILAKKDPMAAFELVAAVLKSGQTVEKQTALALLGELKVPGVEPVLKDWLARYDAGDVAPELHLELLEAAAKRSEPVFKEWVKKFEGSRASKDKVAQHSEALAGGDAVAGREVFFYKSAVSCLRCHKIGSDGGEVGPNLSDIASKQKREYLLESIVDPNKVIAQGFETVILVMNSGKTVAGIIKSENGQEITLVNPQGQLLKVAKTDVDERQKGKSSMPEDVMKNLTRRELRDLVEFLSTLKKTP